MIVGSSFSVRFLHNGDTVSILTEVKNSKGEGMQLFQAIDSTNGAISPDWTQAANQPIISLTLKSSLGYPVRFNAARFAYDGQDLSFNYKEGEWVTANENDSFQSRIDTDSNGYRTPKLKIVKNLASKDAVGNKLIQYSIDYTSQSLNDTVSGAISVLIQQAGSDQHTIMVAADRYELGEGADSTTLRASAMYGVSPVTIGQDGYSIRWYKNDVLLSGKTTASFSITRADVDTGAHYRAELLRNGNVVAQNGCFVRDLADEFQINHEHLAGYSMSVSDSNDAGYSLSLYRNRQLFAGSVTWAWDVYNALHVKSYTGSGANVIVKKEYCICEMNDGSSFYADINVNISAEFNP